MMLLSVQPDPLCDYTLYSIRERCTVDIIGVDIIIDIDRDVDRYNVSFDRFSKGLGCGESEKPVAHVLLHTVRC